MKKLFIVCALVLAVSMTGCGSSDSEESISSEVAEETEEASDTETVSDDEEETSEAGTAEEDTEEDAAAGDLVITRAGTCDSPGSRLFAEAKWTDTTVRDVIGV